MADGRIFLASDLLLAFCLIHLIMAANHVPLSKMSSNTTPKDANITCNLRCLSFNAQSLRSQNKLPDGTPFSNLKSFQDLVYAEDLDIIAVTETWLNDSVSDNEILPSGYKIIRKDRVADKRGGGVLLALRNNLMFNRIVSGNWFDHDRLEIIATELESVKSKKCLLCVCYRPPNCDLNEWLDLFTSFLELTSNYDKVLITGDFNFPDFTWNSDLISGPTDRDISSGSMDFQELTFDFFLQQLNMHPTRLNNILDLVLSSSPEIVSNLTCIQPETMDIFSDHSLLFFDLTIHTKLFACDSRTVFDYRTADWDSLFKVLTLADLSPSPISNQDVDADWQRWSDTFLAAASEHISSKTLRRRNSPPWIDNDVRYLLKKKETARRKAKAKANSSNLWEKFRMLRRRSKALIASKRRQFYQTLPTLLKSSTKKFWSVFKSASKHSNVPCTMVWTRDDKTTTAANNPTEVANLLNSYFYSTFKLPQSTNEYQCHLPPRGDPSVPSASTINDMLLSSTDICDILLSLDANKATGPDKIPARLLRSCAPYICSSLCNLFNKCLTLGKVPTEWKLSNIVPILKGGPTKEVSNYRPISLLPIVSKVMERCVYNKLIAHISSQLHELQFGFLKGKSTTSQLLRVLHEIGELLDKRVQTDAIYLDFAKAFDRVDHQLLLRKLQSFGIDGNLLKWFENYLTDRYQRVTVLGETSPPLRVISGVPQGSILGPLLFLLYVNDLPQVVMSSSIALFADDTKCYREIKNSGNGDSLQQDLDQICEWCKVWRMDLNLSKCCLLSITRNVTPIHVFYHLMDVPVKTINVHKDLGVLVSTDLKWNSHVRSVTAKANKMLGFVRRSSRDIHDLRVRTALYSSLVRSNFAYCSQVWAPQTVSLILTMERVQRRATKFILSLPFRTEVTYKDRLLKVGLLPVTYWLEYLDLVHLYKCLTSDSDPYISIKTSRRVTRSTSNGVLLHVPKCRTVTFQNSFYCRATRVWNILPVHLRNITIANQFKKELFNHYMQLTQQFYNVNFPQSFKSICIKCHSCRPICTLNDRMCCN